MTYRETLSALATDERSQIENDLKSAQVTCEQAKTAYEEALRRVHFLEQLMHMNTSEAAEGARRAGEMGPRIQMTLHAAMHKVIRESVPGKLRAADILAEIERQGLYRMRDGRLPESQQIHARANNYPEMFGKDGTFFTAK